MEVNRKVCGAGVQTVRNVPRRIYRTYTIDLDPFYLATWREGASCGKHILLPIISLFGVAWQYDLVFFISFYFILLCLAYVYDMNQNSSKALQSCARYQLV